MKLMLLLGTLLLAAIAPAISAELGPRPLSPGLMLRGAFAQDRVLQGFSNPLHSSGHYLVVVGTGLIWRSETPFESELVITRTGIVQRVGSTETMRLPATRAPFLARLYALLGGALAGDFSALESEFSVERKGERSGWEVRLVPKRPDDPVLNQLKAITIAGHTLAETVQIERTEGDRDTIRFTDQAVSPLAVSAEESALLATAAQ